MELEGAAAEAAPVRPGGVRAAPGPAPSARPRSEPPSRPPVRPCAPASAARPSPRRRSGRWPASWASTSSAVPGTGPGRAGHQGGPAARASGGGATGPAAPSPRRRRRRRAGTVDERSRSAGCAGASPRRWRSPSGPPPTSPSSSRCDATELVRAEGADGDGGAGRGGEAHLPALRASRRWWRRSQSHPQLNASFDEAARGDRTASAGTTSASPRPPSRGYWCRWSARADRRSLARPGPRDRAARGRRQGRPGSRPEDLGNSTFTVTSLGALGGHVRHAGASTTRRSASWASTGSGPRRWCATGRWWSATSCTSRSPATTGWWTATRRPPSLRGDPVPRGPGPALPATRCERVIDTHCHLDRPAFDADRAEVLARARAAGVTDLVVPAIGPAGWERLLALGAATPGVHAALGIHPQRAPGARPGATTTGTWPTSTRRSARGGAVAVGECGLDGPTRRGRGRRSTGSGRCCAATWPSPASSRLPVLLHSLPGPRAAAGGARAGRRCRRAACSTASRAAPSRCPPSPRWGSTSPSPGRVTYERARKPLLRGAGRRRPTGCSLETDAPDQTPRPHRGAERAGLPAARARRRRPLRRGLLAGRGRPRSPPGTRGACSGCLAA